MGSIFFLKKTISNVLIIGSYLELSAKVACQKKMELILQIIMFLELALWLKFEPPSHVRTDTYFGPIFLISMMGS